MHTSVIDFADPPQETSTRRLRDLPDRVEEGDPQHLTDIHFDEDGLLAGVWTSTPGRWRAFTDRDEFCSILSGHCRLISEDGTVKDFRAGDAFLIPNGFRGWWEVVTTTTKRFVVRDRSPS